MTLWLKDDLASRKVVLQRAVLFATVTLFVLFVFQPFGTNNHTIPFKFLRLSGYSLVTFCALLLSGALEIASIRLKVSNKLRLMIIPCFYIGIVSAFNHSYFVVAILGSWHWQNQLLFILYTFAIGLFPIFFIYLVNRHAQKITLPKQVIKTDNITNQQDENVVNSEHRSTQPLTLTGDNKGDKLQIALSQLLFIKSADNYCEFAIIKDNNVSHQLLRSSLTSILKQLPVDSPVTRCHRSYAVNLALVSLSTGNAGGLKLVMKPLDLTVPVSRSYVETIKQALSLVPKAC
ncbi:LytTR family DNA-binding domain-containing protein [Colwellia hornerae]|uniref:DNA-binding protein n=1 Tax=Colwellia hornerae TaxID=89402 RepID=A0A5C6Q655_9GAMM|nr:LytTR family DNA-binding domain-containing protein [Colwellia hornerae]TWX48853.1 DNA-binding protein [Colwellia hornerae]TWX55353.1 DNA-binding protein [Colwellia hornerae]TWX64424.1 DNA-binding protein [Colwellia hornerae]